MKHVPTALLVAAVCTGGSTAALLLTGHLEAAKSTLSVLIVLLMLWCFWSD